MNWLLSVNNGLSFIVVMLCWWMAHVTSASGGPYNRLVSLGYAVLGMSTLVIAMFRTVLDELEWFPIVGKCALAFMLVTIALRSATKAATEALKRIHT